MALSYTLREGLAGFRRAKLATAASVAALAIALVLIGIVALLAWQWQAVSETLRQRASEAEVFLDEAADAEVAANLGDRLRAAPGVDSVRFVSHEEAAEIFREAFGEGAEIFDDAQFLPASYRVRLGADWAAPDSLARFAEEVTSWAPVEDVAYDRASVEAIERNRRVFSGIGAAVALLVVLAALLLVGNTVRLSIYARRMLIRTMKLVGATNGFIRRPFLIEGAAQGLAAGLVAGAVLWTLYGLLLRWLGAADVAAGGPEAGGVATAVGWPGGTPLLAVGAVVALGVLLGFLASTVAVRRFIRQVRLA
ncbi:cell division protein FtsX [Rubrivirga litoralis]|uniref:Cell division protein FtsX n=1 Tax=Rubrivirga litoralis TaxID=3075598 RepID=A0ABU3BPR8_9BACT|nr:permease-like cell division protein FtsX [Rubrivirga sp. F394]MDT0631263.1 permease-like cell division protein FtsX [Rubrivirga sp. F394]